MALQDDYDNLPEDVRSQIQDHFNFIMAVQNVQKIEDGIDHYRSRYDRQPCRNFELCESTAPEDRTKFTLEYVASFNQAIGQANEAIMEDEPPDFGRIKSLEEELLKFCYGTKGYQRMQERKLESHK
mgnify:CR=1 FL=1